MPYKNFLDFFWLNKFLLQSCGILPISKISFINYIIMISSYASAGFMALPGFYSLIFHWSQVDAIDKITILSENSQTLSGMIKGIESFFPSISANKFVNCGVFRNNFMIILFTIISYITVTLLIVNRKKVMKLIEECYKMWILVENINIYKEISTFSTIAKRLTFAFTINILFILGSLYITSLLITSTIEINGTTFEHKKLPLSMGVIDTDQHYNILYILQVLTSLFSAPMFLAGDTSIAFFTLFGCVYARLCSIYFRNFVKSKNSDDPENDNNIIDIVNIHQVFIEYTKTLEDVFNKMIMMQMLLSIASLCGFSLVFLTVKSSRVKSIEQGIAGSIQLWLYCWPTHSLKIESEAVAHAIYDLPWYNWCKKEKQIVEVVILRSQMVVTLTAGKFFSVSMQTFTAIISKTFSVFTLFRQIL